MGKRQKDPQYYCAITNVTIPMKRVLTSEENDGQSCLHVGMVSCDFDSKSENIEGMLTADPACNLIVDVRINGQKRTFFVSNRDVIAACVEAFKNGRDGERS